MKHDKRPFIILYDSPTERGEIRTPKLSRVAPRLHLLLDQGGTIHILQRDRNPWNQEKCA